MRGRSHWKAPLWIMVIATAVFLFGAALSPAGAADQPLTENGYAYTVENGKATLTAYYGSGGGGDILIVPSKIGGYPVTTIGNGVQTHVFQRQSGRFPDSRQCHQAQQPGDIRL